MKIFKSFIKESLLKEHPVNLDLPSSDVVVTGLLEYHISSNKCPQRLINFETVKCGPY